jgi:hypothetical protein
VAVRKLPPSLFFAKARVLQPGCPTRYFHFIATINHTTNQHALVCESRPFMTSLSHGLPARRPACPAQIQSKENTNVNQQR